jgi:hypothetical protein
MLNIEVRRLTPSINICYSCPIGMFQECSHRAAEQMVSALSVLSAFICSVIKQVYYYYYYYYYY